MNPKIKKVSDEIERTKAKILELQTLLPELERKRIDMENTEIIKLVRSANISTAELPAFLESLKNPNVSEPTTTNQSIHFAPVVEQDDSGGYDDYPDDADNLDVEPLSED